MRQLRRSVFAEGFAGQSANLRSGDKIALMLELFGARRDVYAKYWENAATGKKGYSPAYANDRGMGALGRHAIDCLAACPRYFLCGLCIFFGHSRMSRRLCWMNLRLH
jgi:hypothetical protein